MVKRLIYISLFCFIFFANTKAQDTSTRRIQNGSFYEQFDVLKNDTAIKHGKYLRKYKTYVIERGFYKNGVKYGKWIYYSLDGVFDFEYDYNINKVTKIANCNNEEDYIQTPVFFKGSPIIPHVYLTSHINYPDEAKQYNINGKISLAIDVDKHGKISSLHFKKKLHPLLDQEVMKVAKSFPENWQWIPATYNGINTSGTYIIDVEFELIDNPRSHK